ncbi:threonine synthase [Clostridium tetani]|uniref:threonine synthase n=1 Tax=Clostridium tetani TaxID=1513 RepID=UPI000D220566|nr:threonine synthase [Clostridium tetani]
MIQLKLSYKSTRSETNINSSEAIVQGIADKGGLFVPTSFPKIDIPFSQLKDFDYKRLAIYILKKFLTDFSEEELNGYVEKAYDQKFENKSIVPIVKKEDVYFLELYHGPTLAFKDMALSILPYLLKASLKKNKIEKEVVILTATSGDTGKAALEGFADVDDTKIMVFYPEHGVSPIQKKQMITQKGENTYVIGVNGNFDEAQNSIKEIFNDEVLEESIEKKGYIFSSANSINIGRLIPQIVYYVYSYMWLLKKGEIEEGEEINIVVPTGNFGNILAAYYSKKMGIPVNKFICASNENNVLCEFFNKGIYDKNKEFKITSSPSMDILISSNLERLIYEICDGNEDKVKTYMDKLKYGGTYELDKEELEKLNSFYSSFATDEETYEKLKEVYDKYSYLMDTHTAVAYKVYEDYKKDTGDKRKSIIASTASPFKFTRDVAKALKINDEKLDDFQLIYKISEYTGVMVPKTIEKLYKEEIIHNRKCEKEDIKNVIKEILRV